MTMCDYQVVEEDQNWSSNAKYLNQLLITICDQVIMDDQFEVLFSTNDYLAMQSRCHDLEQQNRKLTDHNKDLIDRLFDMTQKNEDTMKKMRTVEQNNKFLSQEGIKMAQSLLQQSTKQKQFPAQTLDVIMQTDHQDCPKCKQLQYEIETNRKAMVQKDNEHALQKQQLENKIKEQSINSNKWVVEREQIKDQLSKLKNQNQQIAKEVKTTSQINKQLKNRIVNLHKQLQLVNMKWKQQHTVSEVMEADCKQMANQLSSLRSIKDHRKDASTQIQVLKFQINEMKTNQIILQNKLKDKENSVAQYLDLVKGQSIEIVKLEKLVAEKNSLLIFHEQTFKEHEAVFKKYETQLGQLKQQVASHKEPVKSRNMKMQQNSMVQIKQLVEEYFTNLIIRLMEMGAIRKDEVVQTMRNQQRAVKKYIEDVVTQLIPK